MRSGFNVVRLNFDNAKFISSCQIHVGFSVEVPVWWWGTWAIPVLARKRDAPL